jgi:hypothetical protein
MRSLTVLVVFIVHRTFQKLFCFTQVLSSVQFYFTWKKYPYIFYCIWSDTCAKLLLCIFHKHKSIGEDLGETKQLLKCPVKPTIYLRKNAPVMLLVNLSAKLVNGLRGTVVCLNKNHVEVTFKSIVLSSVHFYFTWYKPMLKCFGPYTICTRQNTEKKQYKEELSIGIQQDLMQYVRRVSGLTFIRKFQFD